MVDFEMEFIIKKELNKWLVNNKPFNEMNELEKKVLTNFIKDSKNEKTN